MKRKRPNASGAVRQQRAAKVQEDDDPITALYRHLNYYPSPPWSGRAGAELILRLDPEAKSVWESACGRGHMAEPLREYFPTVFSTDLWNHGYGKVLDFLTLDASPFDVDWVVTNPPFDHAASFLTQGLRFARRGVALLCRIAFLEGGDRYPLLYAGDNPLTRCAPFAERVPMFLGEYDPDGSSPACYAWFLFHKGAPRQPVQAIPPGTKDRLLRIEDVRRFARMAPAPLLDFVP